MKSILLLGCICGCLCLPAAVMAEAEEDLEFERAERHFEIQEREMELQQRRAEMQHEAEMRELELDERRAEMEGDERNDETERLRHGPRRGKGKFMPLLLVCLVVHILAAVWVFQDIRNRNAGSGLWIVIALLSGLFGTLVYAVIRLGDLKQKS